MVLVLIHVKFILLQTFFFKLINYLVRIIIREEEFEVLNRDFPNYERVLCTKFILHPYTLNVF